MPGQVIETSEGLKFVPGEVIETQSGSKFIPGQTIQTPDGPRFIPGEHSILNFALFGLHFTDCVRFQVKLFKRKQDRRLFRVK